MIRLAGVNKYYTAKAHALHDIHLSIEAGDFVSIVGQSGSGKTTLVKLLIAEERPSGGKIDVGGWDITKIHERDVPELRRQIGVIFQDFKLLPKKTVAENVAFALEVAGEAARRIREVVPRVLSIVGLGDKVSRYPHQLSGGEQQRVAIARSLVHRPKFWSPMNRLEIWTLSTVEIIDILKNYGLALRSSWSHNRDIVNRLRRRVVTLHDGKVIADEKEGKYRL